MKNKVGLALEDIISKAKFDYIFLSYNDEGILSLDTIKDIMSKYGKYDVIKKENNRFRADSDVNRNFVKNSTYEFIHILHKN